MKVKKKKKKIVKVQPLEISGSLGFEEYLSNTEDIDLGKALVLFGPPGCGKSSLASYAPNVLFLIPKLETGILDLMQSGSVPKIAVSNILKDWDEVLTWMNRLINEEHGYEWVVIDSLSRLQELLFAHVAEIEFKGDMSSEGFYSYSKGPKVAGERYFREFLDKCDALRHNGVNLLMIAHSNTKPEPNPMGVSFEQIVPDLERAIWSKLYAWSQAVLYYEQVLIIEKKGGKNKVKDSGIRGLYTKRSDAVLAKNRLDLPSFIQLADTAEESWNIFSEAIGG